MQIHIDTESKCLTINSEGNEKTHALYSTEGFQIVSDLWVKLGWNAKYSYTFSWLGRPLIQLPEDVMRMQEVIYSVKPDVIVETGVAHGGSLILYASLFEAMRTNGQVIGIDIEIRPHNRKAIEEHPLANRIRLIEGSSIASETVAKVKSMIQPGEKVLVILDSDHSREHVLSELEAYHSLVSPGSYIVSTDGIMKDVADTPRGHPSWIGDNPFAAAQDFAATHPEFEMELPKWPFNESILSENVTHWPGAWLLRKPD
jgi:cephalosporin hydroxylase